MKQYCIGLDVGGTSVKCGLFQTDGQLLEKWEVPTRKEDNGKFILKDVADSIPSILKKHNICLEELEGIGMGIPGPVLEDGYVNVCVNLGWKDVNPVKQMEELLEHKVTCKASNDANVAALGEMWKGGGIGYQNVVAITLGTGVGSGIILNGKIVDGSHGCAGEVGHMHINDEETDTCNCGGVGCLEQISSATGIVKEAHRNLNATSASSKMREFGDSLSAKDVVDCAKAGDSLAIETIDTCMCYLGQALSIISYVVDPQVFVIGGGVSKAGSWLIEQIEKYYRQFTPLFREKAKIELAKLGNDAGIYGAAKLVIK